MELTLSQLRAAITGAVRIEEHKDGIHLFRFTAQQEALYKMRDSQHTGFLAKSFASSGICIRFETDSRRLALSLAVTRGTTRTYFSVDILVNGMFYDALDNFSHEPLPGNYPAASFSLGKFEKVFVLPDGKKEVCICLPWSVRTVLKAVSLEDGAFFRGIKPEKTLLAFGDSITQGYDALRPSRRYAHLLARKLGAAELNKAIGGEIFFPALAEAKDDLSPDYITVAYGTNDWNTIEEDAFCRSCRAFYTALSQNYPTAKIFALTPIWRKDSQESRPFGAFSKVDTDIQHAVCDLENVTVIPGFDLVPKNEAFFGDFRLHPNDEGFARYTENLFAEMQRFSAE